MTDNKISNYANINKSNHKILKFITLILSILIIICIIFLIIGFINKFEKISENKKNKENIQSIIQSDFTLFYPSESQIISVNYTGDNKVLLRYQLKGKNRLILIDLQNKKIITKINFKKAKIWEIE